MTDYNSDFSSPPRYYSRYYGINTVPEALFLIEAECLDASTNSTTQNKSSQKGVIFGWVLLSILLIICGFQQAYLKDVAPVNSQVRTSNINTLIVK